MRPHAQDITYTVVNSQNKKEKLSLLQGVGGYLQPGEMAALMGCAGLGGCCAPSVQLVLWVQREGTGRRR